MRQLRMMCFHVRQFVSVPYFVQLMIITTVTTTAVQFFAAHAWGDITPTQGWVRGGIIGTWTTATCAAGIIGFERHKGTLAYLVISPIGALRTVSAVVCAASTFGIAALPTAWCTWALLSSSLDFSPYSWARILTLTLGASLLWLGSTALALVVAAIFVISRNAIAYEQLLLVPVFIMSGILYANTSPPTWLDIVSRTLPIRYPYDLLLGRLTTITDAAVWLGVLVCWLLLAALLGRRALMLATRAGSLEVV